mmetsp:Transcript_67753/g.195890  ORF Transcript_67753/g.195890 Transcript_67753/m.195890 type:complete len:323 (+) Transcript_67753:97-1065(+)
MKFSSTVFVFLTVCTGSTTAFTTALFPQSTSTPQQTYPTKDQNEEIELPNFDELFARIQQVSPLSRTILEDDIDNSKGFDAIDKSWSPDLKWKVVESKKNRLVKSVEKIDNFQGLNAPIVRLRASMEGPCDGEAFANFIMNLDDRKKWDAQIDNVYEAYTIDDLDMANMAMGFSYGDCSRMGIGHCKTKANLGIDAREQLTICGINDFEDGSCIIWGTEMEDRHDYLFPPGERTTRARSHIFTTSLTPTGPNTFDVEYVLQLEIGGRIPTWMTTPIVIDNCKKLFACAQKFYNNEDGDLERFLHEKAKRQELTSGPSFLMTP